jgi:multidrug efflux pump subunit AcrA (membrane-fusion protein)
MQARNRIPTKLLWIGRIALGVTLCLNSSGLLAQPNAYVIQARPVISASVLGGTVIPAKEVTLSAQVPGRIEKISGEEGSSFKENTLLISITTEELHAQRRAAMAEFASADAALRNAGVRYQQELFTPDSIKKAPGGMGLPFLLDEMMTEPMSEVLGKSDSKLDRRTNLHNMGTQIDQARGTLMRARSQIEAIDAKLRDAHGLAPFDGVITKKLVEVGDTVQPGTPLLKYADTSSLQIQVEVPARLVSGLQAGMVLNAKLDVGGWVQVRVAQVFPIADAQRHTVTVKFDLPPNTRTGAGQYAQVEIQDVNTPAKYMPIIPTAAIVWRGSLPGVYVLNGGKRELRLLRLGNNYGQEVAVLSGLKHGETIEINPAPGTTSGWVQNGSDPAHK